MNKKAIFNTIFVGVPLIVIGLLIPTATKQHNINKYQNIITELQEIQAEYSGMIAELGVMHDACSNDQQKRHDDANRYRTEIEVIDGQIGGVEYEIAKLVGLDIEKEIIIEDSNDLTGVILDDSGLWRVNSEGKRHKLYNLQGTTVYERTASLLDKFGMRGYYIDFLQYGEDYNIVPEVAICIAFADTSLGQANKTTNNIGNVGNNDSGDEVAFNSMQSGIRALYQTLNNQYIGNNNTIGMLSQGGRILLQAKGCGEIGEFCYATSPENWNVNVINCMNLIHRHEDTKIDENFAFRT